MKSSVLVLIIVGSSLSALVLLSVLIVVIYCLFASDHTHPRRSRYLRLERTTKTAGNSSSSPASITSLVTPSKDFSSSATETSPPSVTDDHGRNSSLMSALFFLRSHPSFDLDSPLPAVGSRKDFFLLKSAGGSGPSITRCLSLVQRGRKSPFFGASTAATADSHEFSKAVAWVGSCSAVFAFPALVCAPVTASDLVGTIRPWHRRGSLRDFIHQAGPQTSYSRKYSILFSLSEKIIARIGRQILEGLSLLRSRGIVHAHLHTGNVFFLDSPGVSSGSQQTQTVTLSEFESNLLCLQPHHIKVIQAVSSGVAHSSGKKASSSPSCHAPPPPADLVCFACVLFEMAAGFELDSIDALDLISSSGSTCPERVRRAIESILKPWWSGTPVTSIKEAVALSLFSDVDPYAAVMSQVASATAATPPPTPNTERLVAAAGNVMLQMMGYGTTTEGEATGLTNSAGLRQHRKSYRRSGIAASSPGASGGSSPADSSKAAALQYTPISQLYYQAVPPAMSAVPPLLQPVAATSQAPPPPQQKSHDPVAIQPLVPAPAVVAPAPAPAPLPPPPPPPPSAQPAAPKAVASAAGAAPGRKSLLDAICGFDASRLKKAPR